VPAAVRVAVAAPAGAAAAASIGVNAGWKYAPAAGWIAGAAVYLTWTWMVAGRMSPEQTAAHATRADTTGSMTDAIVVSASTVSLAGVGYLLVAESAKGGEAYGAAAVGIGSVVVSWDRQRRRELGRHTHRVHPALCPALLLGHTGWNRFQPARTTGLRRFRLPRVHHGHGVSGVRHRSTDSQDSGDGVAAGPIVLSVRVVIVAMTINLIMELSHSIS